MLFSSGSRTGLLREASIVMQTTLRIGSEEPVVVEDWDVSYVDTIIQIQEEMDGPFTDEEDRALTVRMVLTNNGRAEIAFPNSSLAFQFAMAIIEQLDDTYQDAARDSWNG